ncbi:MAG TPA: hypothetical protein PLN38_04805 [Chitinophagales bacterium]|jgi:hypothetical protein|nr:hypothetical protein [Chitinophagales bacterium]
MGKAIINRKKQSNMIGDVVNYAVEYSTMNSPNPNIIEDNNLAGQSEFFDAAEGGDSGDDFYDATGGEYDDASFASDSMPDMTTYDFHDFLGFGKGARERRAMKREKNQLKFGAKNTLAQAQLESAKQQGKIAESDNALASKIAASSPNSTKKSGLSMGAKIGIGVGILAVLGTITYFIITKKKK